MARRIEVLESGGGRQAILKSAAKLFARKGYAGTSIREICAGAGITKPGLYYHFHSKEHLYQELMLDCFNQYQKELLRSAKWKGNLRGKLVSILDSHFRETRKAPLHSEMVLRTAFARGDQPSGFNVAEMMEKERELVAGVFHDAIEAGEAHGEPERLATAFMGISLFVILGSLLTSKHALTRESAEKYVDILLHGCGVAATEAMETRQQKQLAFLSGSTRGNRRGREEIGEDLGQAAHCRAACS